MRNPRVVSCLFVLAFSLSVYGQDRSAAAPSDAKSGGSTASVPAPTPGSFDEVVNRTIQREHFFNAQIRQLHPLVETYIQDLKGDNELGAVPVSDHYFLGRLDLTNGLRDRSFMGQPGFGKRLLSKMNSFTVKFLPTGFAQMVVLDPDFQRKSYEFNYVRREFVGELRCIVIDVKPVKNAGDGRFVGRIWVEDQDFNIVRFNGTYSSNSHYNFYLHFDSWRLNLRPGLWLPAYVYSEESDLRTSIAQKFHFKAQTRLWGYDQQHLGRNDEFAQIVVDSPQSIRDESAAAQDATPVEGQRLWERQAEDNSVERLQKIGLLAPEGEVDKILQTVVNNIMVTNNLDLSPEVRTRVLLTAPLESFTIGRTIVISRGLLDVLPDEASLAMVLAHELSHVALGHRLDTKFAFNDRMFFADENTFASVDFSRSPLDEEAADRKALELLGNSPYKDKLGTAGLFLRALQERAPELKALIHAHLGNGLAGTNTLRMSYLLSSAPQLEKKRTDQIAALPLGGRIKLDPWNDHVELVKGKPVALVSAREKMPFEVTPFFPHLTRFSTEPANKVAQTQSAPSNDQAPAK